MDMVCLPQKIRRVMTTFSLFGRSESPERVGVIVMSGWGASNTLGKRPPYAGNGQSAQTSIGGLPK